MTAHPDVPVLSREELEAIDVMEILVLVRQYHIVCKESARRVDTIPPKGILQRIERILLRLIATARAGIEDGERVAARVLELEDALRACRIYARRAMVAHDVIRPLADIGNTTAIALHLSARTDVSEKDYQAFYATRKESTP